VFTIEVSHVYLENMHVRSSGSGSVQKTSLLASYPSDKWLGLVRG